MKYTSAVKYLSSLRQTNDKKTPERMKLLMQSIGHVNIGHRYIFVHGGEVGYATAKYLEAVLVSAGHRVLMLTHRTFGDFRESVSVNGQKISHTEFADIVLEVQKAVCRIVASGQSADYSQKELLFSIGLLAGKCHGCELVIIHDTDILSGAACVCEPTDVCVLPVVDSDSVGIGGICRNIKKGTRETVAYLQGNGAYKAVSDACAEVGCRLAIAASSQLIITEKSPSILKFSYCGKEGYELKSSSNIARIAAMLTAETVNSLRRAGIKLPPVAVLSGMASVRLRACHEIVSVLPRIIIDTPESAGEVRLLAENFKGMSGVKVCVSDLAEDYVQAEGFDGAELLRIGSKIGSIGFSELAELISQLGQEETLVAFGTTEFVTEVKTAVQTAFDVK